jgi:DNA invertase Pin-like site-specific DNA recombinase
MTSLCLFVEWLLTWSVTVCRRMARAKANGTKLGRRRVKPSVEARILELRANGDGILKIGRKLGVGTSVVQRVFKQEPQPS